MNGRSDSFIRRKRDGQNGQVLVLMAFLLVALLSAAALVIDIGDIYYSYQELESATMSAAMAGGSAIPNGNAITVATNYSGYQTGGALYNIYANLNVTGATPTLGCISTTTYASLGLPPCIVYGTQAAANAIQVTETAKVSTYFAKIFGVPFVNISATATATAKGGSTSPYNIMMVLDTTASMGQGTDTGCGGTITKPTPEQCAQLGVQELLGELDPCPNTVTSCGAAGSNGNVTNPVDEVGLMVFPGLCSNTATGVTTSNCPTLKSGATATATTINTTYAPLDYNCSNQSPGPGNPPIASYNNNPSYLVIPLQSDYRTSDTAGLNTGSGGSNLVTAVGAGQGSCPGASDPGGEGTFYAGALYAAQSYLAANARAGAKNVIILLSDGDANATGGEMGGNVAYTGGTATTFPASNECQQAIDAATAAKSANTLFYSVSYGTETTGCSTDGGSLTPCSTMSSMASSPTSQYFFSVPQTVKGVTSTVCSGARASTTLDQVFSDIAGDLTISRRIPNGAYGGAF